MPQVGNSTPEHHGTGFRKYRHSERTQKMTFRLLCTRVYQKKRGGNFVFSRGSRLHNISCMCTYSNIQEEKVLNSNHHYSQADSQLTRDIQLIVSVARQQSPKVVKGIRVHLETGTTVQPSRHYIIIPELKHFNCVFLCLYVVLHRSQRLMLGCQQFLHLVYVYLHICGCVCTFVCMSLRCIHASL